MKLLLDTHILLWWLNDAPELSERGREIIAEQSNIIFVSVVSIWEIRSKEALGKISVPPDFQSQLEKEPFETLSITAQHAHGLARLPLHHRDPFDRMLIVQAQLDGLVLLSKDPVIGTYEVEHISL